MSQKSEDSIERFFKKGVVQQDKTFMERDWQSMEKMLDDQAMSAASARAGRSKIAARVGVGVVLISFLFLIGVEKDNPERTVQMQAAVGALGPQIKVKNENPAADLHSSENSKSTEAAENSISRKVIAAKKVMRSPRQQRVLQRKAASSEVAETGSGLKTSFPTEYFDQSPDKNSISTPPISSVQKLPINSEISNAEEMTRSQISADDIISPAVNADKLESEKKEIDTQPPLVEEVAELKEVTKEESAVRKNYPKFNVTALISPDFSTTSLTKYSKPSGVFGVLIGFRVSQRFTLMAGATKSLKRYEGYGDEYSPPEGYWQSRTNGVVPDEVEGQCGIIEVPLMIQFDVLQKSKSRLFVSGGVSSYFMRSEHYNYTFNEPNPGAANSWTAKEPTDYLFKIGHLSAGYDRVIGRNFTIGIEPFLKVPFEGIGWTNINLYSTGAYINLRYNILSIHQN